MEVAWKECTVGICSAGRILRRTCSIREETLVLRATGFVGRTAKTVIAALGHIGLTNGLTWRRLDNWRTEGLRSHLLGHNVEQAGDFHVGSVQAATDRIPVKLQRPSVVHVAPPAMRQHMLSPPLLHGV